MIAMIICFMSISLVNWLYFLKPFDAAIGIVAIGFICLLALLVLIGFSRVRRGITDNYSLKFQALFVLSVFVCAGSIFATNGLTR